MLADAERVDADLVGQHALFDDVADDLGMRVRLPVRAGGDVAERIQTEFDLPCHFLTADVDSAVRLREAAANTLLSTRPAKVLG